MIEAQGKIIVIGDIHGRTIWKDILNKEDPQEQDIVIFLGDYFDSFDIHPDDQLRNFMDIMAYKKSRSNVYCLVGNHDFHYYIYDSASSSEMYSGFDPIYAISIKSEIKRNINNNNLIASVTIKDGDEVILFSHAGVSESWWNSIKAKSEISETINELMVYTPNVFKFVGNDPYGDSIESSPIWIRPHSLKTDAIDGMTQVVGHTAIPTITREKTYRKRGKYRTREHLWFVDCLATREYLTIKKNIYKPQTI